MKIYIADFETTVDEYPETQTHTEVWAWGISQLFDNTENVEIGNSIESFFNYLATLDRYSIIYFTNVKFDGQFIMDYIIKRMKFTTAFNPDTEQFEEARELRNKRFIYTITDMGIWYGITCKYKGKLLEFRDTLKLLPFSVSALGDAFQTKHRKLNIEYKGERHAGGIITDEEREYLKNDILVPKEALEKFLASMGYEKNPPHTIGSASLKEFKKTLAPNEFDLYFPDLSKIELDPLVWGYSNADEYIRRSYNGGWCYADLRHIEHVQGKSKNQPNKRIKVYDVNSLYPSMMHSMSGNVYPVGEPHFFKNWREAVAKPNRYYFFRFKCNFNLKPGYLPFVQIKNSPFYRRNENLISSYYDRFGEYDETIRPELVMSQTLFTMFKASYDLFDFEFLDGCWFDTECGIFDHYINKFFKMKQENDKNKVLRTVAKLFLNNLYGKFGTSPINAFKVARSGDEHIEYDDHRGEDKKPVYVPIASAITSYARRFTLSGALNNYDSFCYSDTDSIHLLLDEDEDAKSITVHDTNLCSWKLEDVYENGIYIRQKTYMEFTGDNYDIKCCGLSERGKELFKHSAKGTKPDRTLTNEEREFLKTKRTHKDFKVGLTIPSNLTPRTIDGGCVLIDSCFTIK